MKFWLGAAVVAFAAWAGVSHAPAFAEAMAGLARARTDQASIGGQGQSGPVTGAAPAGDRLSDLDLLTFSCPRAGLNAAAREAAKVRSQGTYQFAFFNIVNDSHHAMYEVHFKSNYPGEADLKYCVSVYCQQGWDPKAKTSVTLTKNERPRAGAATHAGSCGHPAPPANRRLKR